ncbi:MAG: radical SAM protein [Thermodesulfobacteriota bacterium]
MKPGQELQETGAVKKSWRGRLPVALCYPNSYRVGMASLGFLTAYRIFNENEHVVCERMFADPAAKTPPVSVESGRRLSEFSVIAASLSFENDYENFLRLLSQSGIPVRAADRKEAHPLVMAGGVAAWLNPEPLAECLDLVLMGEAEELVPGFLDLYDPERDRGEMLQALARKLPGAYVPSLYAPVYKEDGTLADFAPSAGAPARVRRVFAGDLAGFSTVTPVLARDTAFGESMLVEVSRGCPHGCRFCAAGRVYLPVRFRPLDRLCADLEEAVAKSAKVGLLGASVSDLPWLAELCRRGASLGAELSFSSFRADNISPEIVAAVAGAKQKSATVAPDAGSARMRAVIRKGIREEDVLSAVRLFVQNGVMNVKLYFMVGLPFETLDDVDAVIALVKRAKSAFLAESREKGRMGTIAVTLSSFVPKPFTAFQWAAMDPVPALKDKLARVRQGLRRVPNVIVTADVPRHAFVQGLLARGDRRVFPVLEKAARTGDWAGALRGSPVNAGFFVLRERELDELFPWDFIDHGFTKDALRREWERAGAAAVRGIEEGGHHGQDAGS